MELQDILDKHSGADATNLLTWLQGDTDEL